MSASAPITTTEKQNKTKRILTHHVILIEARNVDRVPVPVAVDRPARLRVAQDALVVDERLRALVRGQVELDEDPLDVDQVALERVEEPARLEVLRRRASSHQAKIMSVSNVLPDERGEPKRTSRCPRP